MNETVLLWTPNRVEAEKEVARLGGRVVLRLSESLLAVRLPSSIQPASVRSASEVDDAALSSMSEPDARLVRAWRLKQRLDEVPDSAVPGRGLSWDAEGFEPPDGEDDPPRD